MIELAIKVEKLTSGESFNFKKPGPAKKKDETPSVGYMNQPYRQRTRPHYQNPRQMPQNTYPYNTPRAPILTIIVTTIPNLLPQNQLKPNTNTQPLRTNRTRPYFDHLPYSYKEMFDKLSEARLVVIIFAKPYEGNYPS